MPGRQNRRPEKLCFEAGSRKIFRGKFIRDRFPVGSHPIHEKALQKMQCLFVLLLPHNLPDLLGSCREV